LEWLKEVTVLKGVASRFLELYNPPTHFHKNLTAGLKVIKEGQTDRGKEL
jgi:hypothetical protein